MADNFDFAALAKSWQQQPMSEETPPSAADLAEASQRQREQKLLMYGEWLGAVIMAGTAVWLLFNLPGWLGGISALFLGLGALSAAYASWHIHRPILAYDNWSSAGLLQFRRRACQLSLQYYRYTQLGCAALILFTLILWLLHLWQLDDTPMTMLLFYSLIVSPACLFGIYRLQQKVQQKATELMHLNRLADDFQYRE
ncbi:hypothetical protein [Rheinheimera pleomorphica]|uniref:hypothetical protein n=1 Tax=Rheinheimera pleomorphica TaxID=2703963 RepID=UPI0014240191|nr:hypothetical protein [Rheinheimera pleomorphica]